MANLTLEPRALPHGLCRRCIMPYWRPKLFALVRQLSDTLVWQWHGTLLEGKEDGTGTQYRRNRYVDPVTGRFTQEDPIGLAGGLNLYGFAAGDPVNYADPFGLADCGKRDVLCAAREAGWEMLGTLAGFGAGVEEGAAAGLLCGPAAEACSPAGAFVGGAVGAVAGFGAAKMAFAAAENANSADEERATSANQMNKQVQRGQGPRTVEGVDKGKVVGEQDHIHFRDGSALNRDGTWKHGGRALTNAEKHWVMRNGWALPK